ncbi:hypothetical protein RB195_000069 [Necator americanus]|uniref:Uncharacterized protein n=1 Tax=Necator americanus TaxID=51031 RepID=A0ABR1D7S3_NECAM
MLIFATFLLKLALISMACHPSPSSHSNSSRRARVHGVRHSDSFSPREKEQHSKDFEIASISASEKLFSKKQKTTTATIPKIEGTTTETSPAPPKCQQCANPPRSDVSLCKQKKCVPVGAVRRIVDECSVEELNCPDDTQFFGFEDVAGELKEYDVSEIGIARCRDGVWHAQIMSELLPIKNIVCFV